MCGRWKIARLFLVLFFPPTKKQVLEVSTTGNHRIWFSSLLLPCFMEESANTVSPIVGLGALGGYLEGHSGWSMDLAAALLFFWDPSQL